MHWNKSDRPSIERWRLAGDPTAFSGVGRVRRQDANTQKTLWGHSKAENWSIGKNLIVHAFDQPNPMISIHRHDPHLDAQHVQQHAGEQRLTAARRGRDAPRGCAGALARRRRCRAHVDMTRDARPRCSHSAWPLRLKSGTISTWWQSRGWWELLL